MKGTIGDCVLNEVYQYEKVVDKAIEGLNDRGYDKGLAINYAPKIVNSFFDSDTDRYLEQRHEPGFDVNNETKRLQDTVAKMHEDGVYITFDDYVELRHEFDQMRKLFSGRD